MNDIVTERRARADDPLRLALATRILTAPEQPLAPTLVPEPTVLAGQVLYIPMIAADPAQCGAAKCLADERQLDMVLIDRAASGAHAFTLGIAFYGRRFWRYGCSLWRPDDSDPACFVPHEQDDPGYFRVKGGILFCEEGRPWLSSADRNRGFAAAQAGLKRLLEGR